MMPFGYEVREMEKRNEQQKSFGGYKKQYVAVDTTITADGKMIPRTIHYDSYHSYEIDKVLEMRRAASLKVGGNGIRYTVRILNKQTYLYFDDGEFKWFVEAKEGQK